MIRRLAFAGLIAALIVNASELRAQPAPIVFFDIATPDTKREAAFYAAVLGWQIEPDGRFTAPATPALRGDVAHRTARAGPTTERIIYAGVPDIARTLEAVARNGGVVVFPRTVVPGVVVLALFTDPAGNRMGLIELTDGEPTVP